METKRRLLYFASACHAYTHIVMLSFPIVAKLVMDEMGLSLMMTMVLISVSGLIYGFGAIPGGYLADRYGSLRVVFVGLGIVVASSLFISMARGLALFAVGSVALGVGTGFYHPSGLNALSSVFKGGRGRAFGTHGLVGAVGQMGAFPIASVIGSYLGWRAIFVVWTLFGCVLLVQSLFLGWRGIEEGEEVGSASYSGVLRDMATYAVLLVLALTVFRGLYYRGSVSILPVYLDQVFGQGILAAGFIGTVIYVASLPGQYLGGVLVDKSGNRLPLMISVVGGTAASMLCIYANSLALFIAGLCMLGFFFFEAQPATNDLVARFSQKRVRGMFYGVTFATRFGCSYFGLILIGWIGDALGIAYTFYVVLMFNLGALATVLLIREGKKALYPERFAGY